MEGKLLLPWRTDLSVYLFTPPSLLSSLPPTPPEASQTQMFYTAYEMFEGHRKRKLDIGARFPLCCWVSLERRPGLSLSLSPCPSVSCIHFTFLSMDTQVLVLVASMYNQASSSDKQKLSALSFTHRGLSASLGESKSKDEFLFQHINNSYKPPVCVYIKAY